MNDKEFLGCGIIAGLVVLTLGFVGLMTLVALHEQIERFGSGPLGETLQAILGPGCGLICCLGPLILLFFVAGYFLTRRR